MSKGTYQAIKFNDYVRSGAIARFSGTELVLGIDAAKHKQFGCIMGRDFDDYDIFSFGSAETGKLTEWLAGLDVDVVVVIEPSGPYSRPIVGMLDRAGIDVRMMQTKRTHDARELFDGVPSIHDGKAAYILARLHHYDLSQQWKRLTDEQRRLRAHLGLASIDESIVDLCRNALESLTAQFWPESTEILGLDSAALQELLIEFGGPRGVADAPEHARQLMRRVSRHNLSEDKIEAVLLSAADTRGVEMLPGEEYQIAETAKRLRQASLKLAGHDKKLKAAVEHNDEMRSLATKAGPKLACTLLAYMGSVFDFARAAAYEKAAGMNLKWRQSGTHVGKLSLTKRGPSRVRKYLWFAAMRLIGPAGCSIARAWYQRRLELNGGNRTKALVAVMRKLIKALYHLGHGHAYDGEKLFDTSRLQLEA